MPPANPAHSRYSSVAILLHWLIALLIIGNLAGGLLVDSFLDSPDPQMKMTGFTIIQLHKAFGITVIGLTLLRLMWRLANPAPPLPAHMTPFERLLAKATHWGFYALMLLVPLSGWAMVSASAKRFPISYFGFFDVPYLPVAQSKALSGLTHEAHELLGFAMIGLIGLHVLAALKHHYFDRDDVLARMLPLVRARGR